MRFRRLTSLTLVALLSGAASAHAQFPVTFSNSVNGSGQLTMTPFGESGVTMSTWSGQGGPAPCAPGVAWNATNVGSGGPSGGAYVRLTWCDWDTSGEGGAVRIGWFSSGSHFEPPGGWDDDAVYSLAFRIKFETPLVEHAPVGACPAPETCQCDGDTQLKFFLWGAQSGDPGEGLKRLIMFFWSGDQGTCGGSASQICFEVRPGIGSPVGGTNALLEVGSWYDLQVTFRWSTTGTPTPFQRIYVNNNVEGSPNDQLSAFTNANIPGWSSAFADGLWPFPADPGGGGGVNGLIDWADADNTGSCVAEDALIGLADVKLGIGFDSSYGSGGGGGGTLGPKSKGKTKMRGKDDELDADAYAIELLSALPGLVF